MERTFEATIEKRDKWYIGWVEAVPGAFSQGRTIKEVEENLKEAVQLILESQYPTHPQEKSLARIGWVPFRFNHPTISNYGQLLEQLQKPNLKYTLDPVLPLVPIKVRQQVGCDENSLCRVLFVYPTDLTLGAKGMLLYFFVE